MSLRKIDFCYIMPTALLPKFGNLSKSHLVLAHLVEQDDTYTEYFAQSEKFKIMDNSAFEMFKQGREMYPSDKLIEMATRCKADMIVMSDYPNEPAKKTIDAAKRLAFEYKEAGFETFFVPQSVAGDKDGYLNSIRWGLEYSDLIDRIGLSILGAPNAYGVLRNPLQRTLARWRVLHELDVAGDLVSRNKQFHCLGMLDGPNEILLLKDYVAKIASWDTSAPVWAGLHGITFDETPTGLKEGKFEREVDFDYGKNSPITDTQRQCIMTNCKMIQNNLKHVEYTP